MKSNTSTLLSAYALTATGQALGVICSCITSSTFEFITSRYDKHGYINPHSLLSILSIGVGYFILWDLFSGLLILSFTTPILRYVWPGLRAALKGATVLGQIGALLLLHGLGAPAILAIVLGAAPAVALLWRSLSI